MQSPKGKLVVVASISVTRKELTDVLSTTMLGLSIPGDVHHLD